MPENAPLSPVEGRFVRYTHHDHDMAVPQDLQGGLPGQSGRYTLNMYGGLAYPPKM